MRTLKLTLSYDGTRFIGWQRQESGESIQGLLEDALARLEGAPVSVQGAGRTDAGVHAVGQAASVAVAMAHDVGTIGRALNAQLPPDIRVTEVQDAHAGFHARFDARGKAYRYLIANVPALSPFIARYAWHIPEPLDRSSMARAAAALAGTHDFAAFQSTGSTVSASTRTLTMSAIHEGRAELPDAEAHNLLVYDVAGDGFLRHMVRSIVGTLVEVGRGQRPAASMSALLESASRAQAGATAPAHGLFLVRVDY